MSYTIHAKVFLLLHQYKRIVVTGGSGRGKTTFSNLVTDRPVIHSDDYLHLPHAERPDAILNALTGMDSWILEGTEAPRVLRRALRDNGIASFADCVILPMTCYKELSNRQKGQEKTIDTIMSSWKDLDAGLTPIFEIENLCI